MKKVAVLSGGAGYLGGAITKNLLGSNFEVIDISRRGAYACDVRDYGRVQEVFADIRSRYANIDVCIHAAAPRLVRKKLLALTPSEFSEHVDTAGLGAFNLFKEAVPLMQKGGTLIGITSQAVDVSSATDVSGSYVPAKYALQGILRVLAAQLDTRFRVYAVAPGFLPGGLNADMPSGVLDFLSRKLAVHASPEDVGKLIAKLVSSTGDVATGHAIRMPGETVTPL